MKIADMHVTPIAISDPPLLNAAGLHAPYALRTIVEIVTDDGLYGSGRSARQHGHDRGVDKRPDRRHRARPFPTQRDQGGATTTLWPGRCGQP